MIPFPSDKCCANCDGPIRILAMYSPILVILCLTADRLLGFPVSPLPEKQRSIFDRYGADRLEFTGSGLTSVLSTMSIATNPARAFTVEARNRIRSISGESASLNDQDFTDDRRPHKSWQYAKSFDSNYGRTESLPISNLRKDVNASKEFILSTVVSADSSNASLSTFVTSFYPSESTASRNGFDNDTRILSIVSVSSTSVVKAKQPSNTKLSTNTSSRSSAIHELVVETSMSSDNSSSIEEEFSLKAAEENSIDLRVVSKRKNPYYTTMAEGNDNHREGKTIFRLTTEVPNYYNDENEYYVEDSRDKSQRIISNSASVKQMSPRPSEDDYAYDEETRAETANVPQQSERVHGEPEVVHGQPEIVYGEPEVIHGQPEIVHGKPEVVHGQPEIVHGEPEVVHVEQEKSQEENEKLYGEPERVYVVSENNHDVGGNGFQESENIREEIHSLVNKEEENPQNEDYFEEMPSKSYLTDPLSTSTHPSAKNDKKSSYIIDSGNFRKYRVEEKTSDGFIVGEYGVVSRHDGSLRGVRYTADSNINPSLIYQTLVKFLSL